MGDEEQPGRELNSWKEIATYPGVHVRAAQLWEETRGLPVKCFPGAKGRVSADTAELDRWKAGLQARDKSSRRRMLAWGIAAAAVSGAILIGWKGGFFNGGSAWRRRYAPRRPRR